MDHNGGQRRPVRQRTLPKGKRPPAQRIGEDAEGKQFADGRPRSDGGRCGVVHMCSPWQRHSQFRDFYIVSKGILAAD
jgi:hypothetical protein